MKKLKKGIVLLITLFFISAISILIIQNLKDSESFFKVVNTNMSLVQTQVSIKNANEQIIEFFKKNSNKDEIIKQLPIVLPFTLSGDTNIKIYLKEYLPQNYISIDDLSDTNITREFKENVDYKYTFFKILKKNKKLLGKNKKFTSQSQIDNVIQEYILQTKDKRILNIKNKFQYGSFDNNSSIYLDCTYQLHVSGINSVVNMIFKVGDTNTTRFEFYFRNSNG